MKFKKLDLVGFKSFFEKTTFHIEEGLTGIVGPNGCGKSNIVEALRWCMGETSAKSMRGAGMEDVIFSGTSNRPEKNIAEVSIAVKNTNKDSHSQYKDFDEIVVRRKIERDKGSKYYINDKEVRARDAQTFFADLSTGAHSPSLISQGKIGQLVTAKPVDRRSVLEEAAGISGIHARRHEAEVRLNAAENNLKRADELKRQQEKQLDNLKKQAEEATKYKLISKEIRKIEAGLFYLKFNEINKEEKIIKEKLGEQEDELSAINLDLNHNNTILENENLKLSPLRDKKMESLAKLQKINLEMTNLENEEKRLGETQNKLKKLLDTVNTDLDRERTISMDSSLNEKRILQEKEELLKTEKELYEIENKSLQDLKFNKEKLNKNKSKLYELIDLIEDFVEKKEPISKNLLNDLKTIIEEITLSQEDYAASFGKNETIKGDAIKRKERIKNIDLELENWKNLKINSDKMIAELNDRKEKIQIEINENQEKPTENSYSKRSKYSKFREYEKKE